jgi:hypothetical protein
MLEQAVIDAEALKEAAIKNAEQEVLDKYAGEIKEAVDVLLEQPVEDPFGMEEMPVAPMGDEDPFDVGLEDEPDDIADKLSMKAVDGEDACACPCPGEDEVIELDLDALMKSAGTMEDEEEDIMFEMSQSDLKDLISEQPQAVQSSVLAQDPEEDVMDVDAAEIANTLMDMFGSDEEDEEDEEDEDGFLAEDEPRPYSENDPADASWLGGTPGPRGEPSHLARVAGMLKQQDAKRRGKNVGGGRPYGADVTPEKQKLYSQWLDEEIELDEDEETYLDEEILEQAIEEILKVDLENVPRGMIGTTHPTKPEQVYAVDVAAAADEDSTEKESNEAFEEAVKKITNLEEQVKSHKSEKNRLIKEHNELKSVARQVSNKLTELNIANAKLVYQNRILESHSLNERQKEKLVETISNANSTEEAKVIFETLQDSLTSKEKNSPQNLSEAISKNNRLVLKSNRKETQASDSTVDRMKKLAGII